MDTADELNVKCCQIPYERAQTESVVIHYFVKYHATKHGHKRNEQAF